VVEFVVSFCFDPFNERGWRLATGGSWKDDNSASN
jgi:hypothetical protein